MRAFALARASFWTICGICNHSIFELFLENACPLLGTLDCRPPLPPFDPSCEFKHDRVLVFCRGLSGSALIETQLVRFAGRQGLGNCIFLCSFLSRSPVPGLRLTLLTTGCRCWTNPEKGARPSRPCGISPTIATPSSVTSAVPTFCTCAATSS
jgi:hypothetical protein